MQERVVVVVRLDGFVSADYPIRSVQGVVEAALDQTSDQFNAIYALGGRASVAPEKLMRALLPQVFSHPPP
jgi:hypothetical protein